MNFDVLTLFPDIIKAYTMESIIKKAIEEELININIINFRDYSKNKHKKVDDYPYSGGGGMILKPQPIFDCYKHLEKKKKKKPFFIYMTPKGEKLNNDMVKKLSNKEDITILCGRYEGVDQRVIDKLVDKQVSIGDYVMTGGELAALVLIDSVTRFQEGVLSTRESYQDESHYNGLIEYPQYTRPYDFEGLKVPDILLSGHDKNIKNWKRTMSIVNTIRNRPDIDIEKFAKKEEIDKAISIIRDENK